jgi:hypothetical protein
LTIVYRIVVLSIDYSFSIYFKRRDHLAVLALRAAAWRLFERFLNGHMFLPRHFGQSLGEVPEYFVRMGFGNFRPFFGVCALASAHWRFVLLFADTKGVPHM